MKLRRQEEFEQIRTSAKKMERCLIFSRHNSLCLNILWLKPVSEITVRQIQTILRKHDVIKVCGIEYLTTQIELALATFKSWTVHKIMEYLTLGCCLAFEISITVQQLTFLTHPVQWS